MIAAVRREVGRLTWLQRSLLVGALLSIAWMTTTGLTTRGERLLRDGTLYLVLPLAFGLVHRRHLGWTIDRRAVRNAILLSAFVLPIYLVGSTLPTIRAYYPMWGLRTTALAEFLPHALYLFLIALAWETYFRGLLCVGLRESGPWVIFVSPVVYALQHLGKPPIEAALSAPADVLFGAADYDAGSILPSVCAHGLGMVLLDYLVLREPLWDPERTLRWLEWVPVPL